MAGKGIQNVLILFLFSPFHFKDATPEMTNVQLLC